MPHGNGLYSYSQTGKNIKVNKSMTLDKVLVFCLNQMVPLLKVSGVMVKYILIMLNPI